MDINLGRYVSNTKFELIFDRGPTGFSQWGALLKSPLLDPSMHHKDTLRIMFGDTTRQDADKELLVDSFQLGSLLSYLQEQSNIKRMMQEALQEHVRQWHLEEAIGTGDALWSNVCVGQLTIDRPNFRLREAGLTAPSTESSDSLFAKLPAHVQKAIKAQQKRPLPTTSYSIILEAKWQDGHQRLVEVEDGQLVKLVVDG